MIGKKCRIELCPCLNYLQLVVISQVLYSVIKRLAIDIGTSLGILYCSNLFYPIDGIIIQPIFNCSSKPESKPSVLVLILFRRTTEEVSSINIDILKLHVANLN